MIAFVLVADFVGIWLGEATWRRSGDLLAAGCMTVLAAMLASLMERPRVPEGVAMCDLWAHMGAMITAFTIVTTRLLPRLDRREPLVPDMASLLFDTGRFLALLLAGGSAAGWSTTMASAATGHEDEPRLPAMMSGGVPNHLLHRPSPPVLSIGRLVVLKAALAPNFTKGDAITAMKASDRIRLRLMTAGRTWRANDNIAEFIEDGELDELQLEVESRMKGVLRALVIDTENDHNTAETARRVARMFVNQVFSGRYRAAPSITAFPNVSRLNELMIVGPIAVRSACSHHLCPIMGKVWAGILPNATSDLIGLSKYARLCDWIMSRPQIQEEAVVMLADELERRIRPDGLAVVIEADHFCMHWRGVKDGQSVMTNSVMRGAFLENEALRREFLSLRSRATGDVTNWRARRE